MRPRAPVAPFSSPTVVLFAGAAMDGGGFGRLHVGVLRPWMGSTPLCRPTTAAPIQATRLCGLGRLVPQHHRDQHRRVLHRSAHVIAAASSTAAYAISAHECVMVCFFRAVSLLPLPPQQVLGRHSAGVAACPWLGV